MKSEIKLLTAICENKDIASVMNHNVDELFDTHRDVWDFVKEYWSNYKSVPDTEVVEEKFLDFDPAEVGSDTQYYLDELREDYVRSRLGRMLRTKSKELRRGGAMKVLENITKETSRLSNLASTTKDVDITDFEPRLEHMERMAKQNRDGYGTVGIPTQINAIDNIFGGLQPGDFNIVMGWTGSLKSWLSLLIACRAWDAGYKPLIVNMEMTPEQVGARIDTILGMGEFSNKDLMNGQVDFDGYKAWASKTFKEKNGFIVVSREGMREVTTDMVWSKVDQHRPDLVVIDYQNLMADGRGTTDQTRKNLNIANDLMGIAGSAKVPVIDICAVTQNDDHGDRPPHLNEVAWAKQIAYNADLALALCSYYDHLENMYRLEAVARKVRRAEPFAFSLEWDIDRGVVTEEYGIEDESEEG